MINPTIEECIKQTELFIDMQSAVLDPKDVPWNTALVTAGELMKDYILCGDGTMGDVTEEWDEAINAVFQQGAL